MWCVKMNKFSCWEKMRHNRASACLSRLSRVVCGHGVNPFWIHIFYFLFLSSLGYWVLKVLKPTSDFKPRKLDLYFTSVSAATVSSMSTVEMEVFSNSQLIVMTILMFMGGEVFTSMAGLFMSNSKPKLPRAGVPESSSNPENITNNRIEPAVLDSEAGEVLADHNHSEAFNIVEHLIMHQSIKLLRFVVLGYLLLINMFGVALVCINLSSVSSARSILKSKGLKLFTFSVFTTVSTFTNCGFVPTNENMIVFSKNSTLLLILIPQVLLGNTLFPACLRFSIWVLGKAVKRVKCYSDYLLNNTGEIGYRHLLPSRHSWCLVATVVGFILVQLGMFCAMEWTSEALNGLNSIEKIIGILFQSVNSRHTGETIVDLSIISPAILVLFIVMMYLPPYTTFLFVNDNNKQHQQKRGRRKKRGKIAGNLFSQLAYLAIFAILICITERKNIKEDPLNFNALNIVLEVVSAYGNVGFTPGYSCKRRLISDANCEDKWYGFVGKWSDGGKSILIVVMLFGRLKKFNMRGGKAWKLS